MHQCKLHSVKTMLGTSIGVHGMQQPNAGGTRARITLRWCSLQVAFGCCIPLLYICLDSVQLALVVFLVCGGMWW